MISRIKGIVNLSEDVNTLNRAYVINKKLIEELSEGFKKELEELKEIKSYQLEFLNDFKKNQGDLQKLKGEMQKELEQLRQVRFETQRDMLKRFEHELNLLFQRFSKELSLEKDSYERAKSQVEATVQNLFLLQAEMQKFMEISRHIKSRDYELAEYHKALLKEDQNKLDLMKKIDALEKICAHLKRRQRD